MRRLTTNKPVSEMGMYELAHNCCFIKDGETWYRDYEREISIRDLAREIAEALNFSKNDIEYLKDDDNLDEWMMGNLEYSTSTIEGLLAVFYRNLWAMADLAAVAKHYEDLEEGKMEE